MLLLTLALSAHAQDALVPGEVEVDPPTLVTAGVRWLVSGDDDHDATVAVRFREQGGDWRDAMPLFRVHPEHVFGRTVPDQLAGSIFDLRPGTTYEVELHAVDPDGTDETRTVEVTTRPVPAFGGGNAVSVTSTSELQDALRNAEAGDVITLAEGTYTGTFSISASGTASAPIVLRGPATLDGGGSSGNVLEVYGSHVWIESLTIRNANRALRFQGTGAVGNVVRRVQIADVQLGIGARDDQRDFLICDNVLDGPLEWPHVYPDDGGTYANVDGIVVMGDGHVVCHNRLTGWGDAIKLAQDGSRGVDVYGNDVAEVYDNGFEFDGSEGNVRAFRNRFTNTYATLSFQPVYGGPAYALRNVVVNVAHEQLKLHSLGGWDETSGVLVLHNTFVSPSHAITLADSTTSRHLRLQGNLFVGPEAVEGGRTVSWTGGTEDASFDGNGWWPDGRFDLGDEGDWPSFAAMQADGVEANGVLLGGSPFADGLVGPATYTVRVDATVPALSAGSEAVDAALPLANVNDAFAGAGPDLGALELGCDAPAYGPRPEGVDEDDVAAPCGDEGDTDAPGDTDAIGDTDDEDGGGDDADAGCGCGGGGGSGGSAILGLLPLVARRRRLDATLGSAVR